MHIKISAKLTMKKLGSPYFQYIMPNRGNPYTRGSHVLSAYGKKKLSVVAYFLSRYCTPHLFILHLTVDHMLPRSIIFIAEMQISSWARDEAAVCFLPSFRECSGNMAARVRMPTVRLWKLLFLFIMANYTNR